MFLIVIIKAKSGYVKRSAVSVDYYHFGGVCHPGGKVTLFIEHGSKTGS